MPDCAATVSVDRFSPDGVIVFIVDIADCNDSEGRFDFEYWYYNGDIRQRDTKSETWRRTFDESSSTVRRDVGLGSGQVLDEVAVIDDSIQCTCHDA